MAISLETEQIRARPSAPFKLFLGKIPYEALKACEVINPEHTHELVRFYTEPMSTVNSFVTMEMVDLVSGSLDCNFIGEKGNLRQATKSEIDCIDVHQVSAGIMTGGRVDINLPTELVGVRIGLTLITTQMEGEDSVEEVILINITYGSPTMLDPCMDFLRSLGITDIEPIENYVDITDYFTLPNAE